jgi:two-component system, NarL family, response regulator NreC
VLVLDLMMPGPTGLQLCRQMAAIAPHTRVIILSAHANEAYVWEAIRNGARAYVLKSASTTDLVQAIDAVMQGERYFSSPFTDDSLAHYTAQRAAGTDPGAFLTARELEVLHLAAQGLSAAEIGAQLVISPRTAEKHRAHLLAKLNLRSQTELVRWAVERGIA